MPCYIFDVDDTLVHYVDFNLREWYEFIAEPVARRYGVPLSFDIWKGIIEGKLSRRYTEKYGLSAKQFWKEVDKRNLEYRKMMLRNGRLKAYDDVLVLREIKGKKIAWSVSSEECIRFVLSTFSLLKFFDFIIGKDYEDYAYLDEVKPSPRFIEIIKEKMECEKCIVIGDSERDMLAAKGANCIGVFINREGKRSEHADFTISSLEGLLNKNFL